MFLINYWIIVSLFILLGLLIGTKDIPGSVLDVIGNYTALNETYNGTWWYVLAYIIVVLLSSMIIKSVEKKSYLTLVLFGVLYCMGYFLRYNMETSMPFAEWGVDYLKYDFCYQPKSVAPDVVYKHMGLALAHCGRDILFSACSWGFDKTPMWIRETGAHCWRSTGDISDSWVSIKNIAMSQLNEQVYNAPGCFNDMDMLVVGMHGNGNVGLTGCTEEEYKLHFSFWSFLSSPLMIGCDIRNMTEETKRILLNKDIIAINQDTAGRQAFVLNLRKQDITDKNPEAYGYILDRYTMARYLENGDIAIAMFNFLDVDTYSAPLTIQPDMLGLPEGFDRYEVQDLWTGEILKSYNGTISPNGPCKAHGCQMFRLRILP